MKFTDDTSVQANSKFYRNEIFGPISETSKSAN